jgi:hypothetical protein
MGEAMKGYFSQVFFPMGVSRLTSLLLFNAEYLGSNIMSSKL